MFNAMGLLTRTGISPVWAWPLFALALIVMSLFWRKLGMSLHVLSLGIIVGLFCAPHLHAHDLSLLSLPILLVHPLAPALASAFLVSSYAFGLQHWAAYALMVFLALFQLNEIHKRKASTAAEKAQCADLRGGKT